MNLPHANTIDAAEVLARELSREAWIVVDRQGQILEWNKGASNLYGWSAGEAEGKTLDDLFGPAVATVDSPTGAGEDRRRLIDGRCLAIQWKRARIPNSEMLVEISSPQAEGLDFAAELTRYRTIYRSTGAVVWEHDWSGVWEGVEELRRQGINDFRHFFIENPDILAGLSSRVRILDANDEAVHLFEADDRDHLVNGPLPRIFTDDTRASFTRSVSSLIEKRPRIESECGFKTLRGNPLRIMLRVTPIDKMRWERVLVTMIDITERTKAQLALNQALDELAHISRVTTLGELTASIAHELNQPLVAIVTEGQGALRWLDRDPPVLDRATSGMRRAVEAGLKAGQILNRLRALARKDGRKLERLSLNDVIDEAAMLVQRELQRRHIALHIDRRPTAQEVLGDRIQLEQVVINLLINGAQAMEASESRMLVVSVSEPAEDMVGVRVLDRGTGISADQADLLFKPFKSTKAQGLGMGLSICRSIIESHGGRIWIENREQGGAIAQFTLPSADSVEKSEADGR